MANSSTNLSLSYPPRRQSQKGGSVLGVATGSVVLETVTLLLEMELIVVERSAMDESDKLGSWWIARS